ncbi:MAG TPA: TonB-dependent receptor [Rhizomicrobium sp.]|nr:TonB-dependent receptor [Rhizomicrobium sp.]
MAKAQEVETVVVTGSRIPQVGLYSSSPVTAVNQQEIKYEGTTNVETLLNNLPGVFADFTETASNGATGQATVDLRGLGSARTLVLVDGTRLMPSDPQNPVADLNQVPAALVDHVEVQTGGASAVYGSDAEGGVVNFIMRKDFEGVEVDAQYSVNNAANGNSLYDNLQKQFRFPTAPKDWWGGATTDSTLIIGTNTADGKGNITAYVGYRNIQPVLESARDFSACSISAAKNPKTGLYDHHVCAGSANYNLWISFDDYYAYLANFANRPNRLPGGPISNLYWFGQQDGTFTPYTGAPNQKFNYGPLNYLQRPDTRYTGGFFAHYQINPSAEVYSDFMFSDDHTLAQIAPSGAFLGTGEFGGLNQVNCDNPLMTAQERHILCGYDAQDTHVHGDGSVHLTQTCTPDGTDSGNCNLVPGQALLEIGRRDVEGGNRIDDLRHTSYRMKVGLRGDIGHGWTYDVYGQYGTTVYAENYSNEWSVSRVQNALQVNPDGHCKVADSGVDPNCVPLDLFHGFGALTPDMLDYVKGQGFKSGDTEERIVSGAVTGDLGEWGVQSPWAKAPVQLSLGAEYRSESLFMDVSRDFSTGDLYGQGGPTNAIPKAGFDVEEGFGEVRIPVVQDAPLAKDITLNGGYRYSSYSSAGAVSSYKYGIDWQIIDDVRFRGSEQHATRAPSVLESFTPASIGLFGGQDICSKEGAAGDATIIANCKAQGVTNAGSGLLNCPAAQCNGQFGGNTTLVPESSDTWSFGAVLTPTFLDGFTATVDYFDIKVNKFISGIDTGTIMQGCYGDNADATSQAFFCPLIHRNNAHQIFGGGFIDDREQNLLYLKTRGIDFEANYNTDLADWGMSDSGSLSVNMIGTWLDTLTTLTTPISPKIDCAGLYGPTCGNPSPTWRHKMRVTWTSPWDFALSLDWRHLSSVKVDAQYTGGNIVNDTIDARIPSFDYFDLSANYTLHTGIELRAGVDNLFDKSPPVLDSNVFAVSGPAFGNGNTFPGVYDSLGRTIFIGVTAKY